MSHIAIRYNKTRGQPGRGTPEHRWRVFTDGKEYLFKHVKINVPSASEQDPYSDDWNMACEGVLHIDRNTSTAIIDTNKTSIIAPVTDADLPWAPPSPTPPV